MMLQDLIDPSLPLAEQNARLRAMLSALMDPRGSGADAKPPDGATGPCCSAGNNRCGTRTRDLAEALDKLRVKCTAIAGERDAVSARNSLVDALEAMARKVSPCSIPATA